MKYIQLFEIPILCFLCFVLLESSGGYAETPNAFIFSLNNFETLAPFVSKVKTGKERRAIYRHSYYGPKFSDDLVIYLDAIKKRTQKHAWAPGTLFHLECMTRSRSWLGLSTSHLMRWRCFILAHPAKCKITWTEFNWKWSETYNIT